MTDIKLWNSKTRRKEAFVPSIPGRVSMYVCGPTVYDRAHLGNARPVVVFDVLNRLMRHVYGADNVTYVRNFTDVDDKINARAAATGRSIGDITEETIGWFHDDMDALGALRPDHEPRATEFVPQMVTMIEGLIAKGHAYAVQGHVLFRVRSYADYGALSGRSVDDMIAGARVEVSPFKEDPMDFVLWKPSDDTQPGWEGPKFNGVMVSYGRPGWHIECSAMADELLMKDLPEDQKSFDIHGGGLDLQFPHHENELAQSKCAHPHGEFARVWMHNEMLQVEGKKMSKSLGNFFTVRDLLDQGVPGEVIRFVLLGTHYRKPMDWTKQRAYEAEMTLRKWRSLVENVEDYGNIDADLVGSLADDLNTVGALARLFDMAKQIAANATRDCHYEKGVFLSSARLFGLLEEGSGEWIKRVTAAAIGSRLDAIANVRHVARQLGDYAKADFVRRRLAEVGIVVQDGKQNCLWFADPLEIWPTLTHLDKTTLGISPEEGMLSLQKFDNFMDHILPSRLDIIERELGLH